MRLVGIEWEVNSYRRGGYVDDGDVIARERSYQLENDLRRLGLRLGTDGSCGWEIRTPPIEAESVRLRDTLKNIGKAIVRSKLMVDRECGLHVHVDARDLTDLNVKNLVRVYKRIEPALYSIAGKERARNGYCLRYKWDEFGEHDLDIIADDRYRGMNISPWFNKQTDKTTIEFRMHRGTKDWQRVYRWANLCASVVEFAKRKPFSCKLDTNPGKALKCIAGKWVSKCAV